MVLLRLCAGSRERCGLERFNKGENRWLAPRVNCLGVELELSCAE